MSAIFLVGGPGKGREGIIARGVEFELPFPRGPRVGAGKSAINLPGLSVDSIRNERHKFIRRSYLIWRDDLGEYKPMEGEPGRRRSSQTA